MKPYRAIPLGKPIKSENFVYGWYAKIENDHVIIELKNEWYHEGRGDFIGDYIKVDPTTVSQCG